MLVRLDHLLAISGAIVLLMWTMRLVVGFPSVSPIHRPSYLFREDAVLLVTLVYLVAAMFLSALMKSIGRSSDQVLTGLVVNNGAQLCGLTACMAMAGRRVPGGMRWFVWGEPGEGRERGPYLWFDTVCTIIVAVGVCPLVRDLTAWFILRVDPGFEFGSHPALQALEKGGLDRKSTRLNSSHRL